MSTELDWNAKWKTLQSFPFTHCSRPFIINNNEFIAASYKTNNGDGIYKYNIHKNEWVKIFNYEKDFKCVVHSAAYDNKNKLLYICSPPEHAEKMFTFDLKTKSKVTSKEEQNKKIFELVFVENKLHQICQEYSGTVQGGDHYVYDTAKTSQKITSFQPFDCLYDSGIIYLESKKSIVALGGYQDGTDGSTQNAIYEFSCVDSQWKELNIKIPIKLAEFGLVATKNEQYIIILGGRTNCGRTTGYMNTNDIFIYNTRNNTFTKSKIKCPKQSKGYYAVMVNNSSFDEMKGFGFVNDCYKSESFKRIQPLPQYLIKIICCYFCHEEIYLLQKSEKGHWKINVDQILE